MSVARYYDEEKAGGQFFPGVPARDLTEEEFDALPGWLQKSLDATKGPSKGMYRKTKPKGWKAPVEPEPEPTPEPTPVVEPEPEPEEEEEEEPAPEGEEE